MALTRWNPSGEIFFFGGEMDPIFEDYLAQALDECPEDQENRYEFSFSQDEQELKQRVLIVSMAVP
jgi:hypothetical protein